MIKEVSLQKTFIQNISESATTAAQYDLRARVATLALPLIAAADIVLCLLRVIESLLVFRFDITARALYDTLKATIWFVFRVAQCWLFIGCVKPEWVYGPVPLEKAPRKELIPTTPLYEVNSPETQQSLLPPAFNGFVRTFKNENVLQLRARPPSGGCLPNGVVITRPQGPLENLYTYDPQKQSLSFTEGNELCYYIHCKIPFICQYYFKLELVSMTVLDEKEPLIQLEFRCGDHTFNSIESIYREQSWSIKKLLNLFLDERQRISTSGQWQGYAACQLPETFFDPFKVPSANDELIRRLRPSPAEKSPPV